MGSCTSNARHRQKQQLHSRITSKNSIDLDTRTPPPIPPFPLTIISNQHSPYSFSREFTQSTSPTKTIFYSSDTNSLIQLYSAPGDYICTNSHQNYYMSSSTAAPAHPPPRIPIPKTRVPIHRPPVPTATNISSRQAPTAVISNNQTGFVRPMSITNRPPPPTSMQNRFGFIPRSTVSGQNGSTFVSRSRSISPTSTISIHSSSSSLASQRAMKNQTVSKSSTNSTVASPLTPPKTLQSTRYRNLPTSKSQTRSNLQTPNSTSRLRSRTPSRTSATSPSSSSSVASPTSSSISPSVQTVSSAVKTDVNAIRDRYKNQKRMNFFACHTPISTANGSPMMANSDKSPKSENTTHGKPQTPPVKTPTTYNKQRNNDIKLTTPPNILSNNIEASPSALPPSAHLSQGNRHRQRAISMLSSASGVSDVLNREASLEDDNCSLKSDDLICDYDDTLTIESTSKNEQTDSCSSMSLVMDNNHKMPSTVTITPTKPNISSISKEYRTATTVKPLVGNGSLRESLDELSRLSSQVDSTLESENNRKLNGTRSLSMKPPSNYLPPLEDSEQITMDIESYRQVMKDVMVVKTILHQLDRVLKHSDGGGTMTDSMIGSFHEYHDPMIASRRFSSSTDGNLRTPTDENLSYDDLVKELVALRKEREQDKQTIKLLQEQMYKYSSHVHG